jgi:hypothetical protein
MESLIYIATVGMLMDQWASGLENRGFILWLYAVKVPSGDNKQRVRDRFPPAVNTEFKLSAG